MMLLFIQVLVLLFTRTLGHSQHLSNCDLSHGAHCTDPHYVFTGYLTGFQANLQSDCSSSPGLARAFVFDFVDAFKDGDLATYWTEGENLSQGRRLINLDTNGKGAAMSIWVPEQTPSLSNQYYMFFGKVSVELQAASGQGVVSAIVLKSDSGNEISWEILGMYDNKLQANYLFHGDTESKGLSKTFVFDSTISTRFHTYSIEWTQYKIAFSVDGHEAQTWYIGDIPPEKWPQTPMKLHLSTWVPNQNMKDYSVAKWAGGMPNWQRAPFTAFFRKVEISDFAGLCLEVDGPVEYVLEEGIKVWQDVKVKGCRKRFTSGMDIPHPGPPVPSSRPAGAHSTSPAISTLFSSGGSRPTDKGSKTSNNYPEKTGSDAEGIAASVSWPRPPTLVAVLFLVWFLLS